MTDFIIGFVVCLWAFSFGIHVESTSSLKKALKGFNSKLTPCHLCATEGNPRWNTTTLYVKWLLSISLAPLP